MNAAYMLLEVDPSIVRPGWIALVVTLLIGAALAVLFFSLRRQMRRISPDLPYSEDVDVDELAPPPTPPHSAGPPAPDITQRRKES